MEPAPSQLSGSVEPVFATRRSIVPSSTHARPQSADGGANILGMKKPAVFLTTVDDQRSSGIRTRPSSAASSANGIHTNIITSDTFTGVDVGKSTLKLYETNQRMMWMPKVTNHEQSALAARMQREVKSMTKELNSGIDGFGLHTHSVDTLSMGDPFHSPVNRSHKPKHRAKTALYVVSKPEKSVKVEHKRRQTSPNGLRSMSTVSQNGNSRRTSASPSRKMNVETAQALRDSSVLCTPHSSHSTAPGPELQYRYAEPQNDEEAKHRTKHASERSRTGHDPFSEELKPHVHMSFLDNLNPHRTFPERTTRDDLNDMVRERTEIIRNAETLRRRTYSKMVKDRRNMIHAERRFWRGNPVPPCNKTQLDLKISHEPHVDRFVAKVAALKADGVTEDAAYRTFLAGLGAKHY